MIFASLGEVSRRNLMGKFYGASKILFPNLYIIYINVSSLWKFTELIHVHDKIFHFQFSYIFNKKHTHILKSAYVLVAFSSVFL